MPKTGESAAIGSLNWDEAKRRVSVEPYVKTEHDAMIFTAAIGEFIRNSYALCGPGAASLASRYGDRVLTNRNKPGESESQTPATRAAV